MGVSNKLSCEAGSFSCHCNPHMFLQSEVLRLYFSTLEPWVVRSDLLPSWSSWFFCMQMWDCWLHHLPPHWVLQPLPCCESAPTQLPISAPPTSLDECVFFKSLVVWLPYSSVLCQFWLFFVCKLLLSLFWLCRETKCIYLRLHLGWESGTLSFIR